MTAIRLLVAAAVMASALVPATNSRRVIRAASKKEDVAAPRRINPRRHWSTVEQFATSESEVAASLHLETVNQIRLQFANHAGEARWLLEVIETLKHRGGSASAARKRRGTHAAWFAGNEKPSGMTPTTVVATPPS